MFTDITVPYDSVMLFNILKLKEGVTVEDVELALGEMCNVVKNTYGNDGFYAGQVFKYAGFISDEGSVGSTDEVGDHIAIVTYWKDFETHEKSHADCIFKEKFEAVAKMCYSASEYGYKLLWQGVPE